MSMISKLLEYVFKACLILTPIILSFGVFCVVYGNFDNVICLFMLFIILSIFILLIINFAKNNLELFSICDIDYIGKIYGYELVKIMCGYNFYYVKINDKKFILITKRKCLTLPLKIVRLTDDILIEL